MVRTERMTTAEKWWQLFKQALHSFLVFVVFSSLTLSTDRHSAVVQYTAWLVHAHGSNRSWVDCRCETRTVHTVILKSHNKSISDCGFSPKKSKFSKTECFETTLFQNIERNNSQSMKTAFRVWQMYHVRVRRSADNLFTCANAWDVVTVLSDHRTRKGKTTCVGQRTSARQALGQIHHNACLKHSNSSTDQNSLIDQLLCSWNIMATARGQGLKQLAPHIQIPTRSVHRMFRIRSYESFSCCILHIHALPSSRGLENLWRRFNSPSTLQIPGLFECHEILPPMECVPEISCQLWIEDLSLDNICSDTSNHITPYRSAFHSCASCSRSHVCSRCKVSATGNTQFLQYLRKIDFVWPSPDAIHTDLILDELWVQVVDVALYLVPRQGLRE